MSNHHRNDTSWALGGGDDVGFEDVMAQLGVRRTGAASRASPTPPPPPSARKGPPSPREAATARANEQREAARKALQPAPPAAPAPAPAPAAVAPSPASSLGMVGRGEPEAVAAVAVVPTSALVGRVEELEQQLSAARSALAAEREARHRLQDRLRELEESRDRAVGQAESLQLLLEEQELQLRRLKRRIAGSEQGEAAAPPLIDVLERRGLKGADEAAFLIRGLLQTRQLDGLLERLQADDPDLLRGWLEDRVALLCSAHAELAPSGRAAITVPPSRCEVCGGSELKRTVRHFVDTCLIHGLTRVSVVGGSPKHHHMLRNLVQHRALRIQLAPSLEQRTPSQVRSDLDNSDVVLLWMRGARPELSAQYTSGAGGAARVLISEQDSLARLLAEAAEQILRG